MKRPWRSPIEVPRVLREHIEGKIVCEIGCAEGDLLPGFAEYAEKVYGIEEKRQCYRALRVVEKENDNVEIFYRNVSHDVTENDLPEADLYYFWINPEVDELMLNKIIKGKVVSPVWPVGDHFYQRKRASPYDKEKEYITFVSEEPFIFQGGPRGFRKIQGDRRERIYKSAGLKAEDPITLGILNKGK